VKSRLLGLRRDTRNPRFRSLGASIDSYRSRLVASAWVERLQPRTSCWSTPGLPKVRLAAAPESPALTRSIAPLAGRPGRVMLPPGESDVTTDDRSSRHFPRTNPPACRAAVPALGSPARTASQANAAQSCPPNASTCASQSPAKGESSQSPRHHPADGRRRQPTLPEGPPPSSRSPPAPIFLWRRITSSMLTFSPDLHGRDHAADRLLAPLSSRARRPQEIQLSSCRGGRRLVHGVGGRVRRPVGPYEPRRSCREEVVDSSADPKRFKKLGAKVPK